MGVRRLARRAWARVRTLFGRPPDYPPPDDFDAARVPVGPPGGPRPTLAAEAEPPPDPEDTDAYGREA